MDRPWVRVWIGVVLAATSASAASGCGKSGNPEGARSFDASATAGSAAHAGAPTPAAPPFAWPKADDGYAYIIVENGLAAIAPDGTPRAVTGLKGWTSHLTIGADGHVYVAATVDSDYGSTATVYRVDDAVAKPVATAPFSTVTALGVGSDGTIDLAQNDELYEGAAGSGPPRKLAKVAGAGVGILRVFGHDETGALVADGMGGVAVRAGSAWTKLDIPGRPSYDEPHLVGDGSGLVVAVRARPLLQLKAGALVSAGSDLLAGSQDEAPMRSSTGILAVQRVDNGKAHTLIYGPGGSRADSDLERPRIARGALDARGRVWYVDDEGLTIAPLPTGAPTTYAIGVLPALLHVGSTSSEGDIVVVGAGPSALPPVTPARVIDTVKGRLELGGAAAAGVAIEMCASPNISYETSPCESDSARKEATTDDKGAFAFTSVPVGSYEVAVHQDKWGILNDTHLELFTPGPTKDVGALKY